jgi:alpha-L-fucosidase
MLATLIAALAVSTPALQGGVMDYTKESPADREKRIKWFREARFGMFVHWGLYAIPAGVWKGKNHPGASEWLLNTAQIKIADYLPLLDQFNPVKFEARKWAKIAKGAGMKYLVITSKHHDGFGLWHSKQTEWDVESTPFKRDILRELAAACKAEGIKFCLYHSIMDWHHPDYLPRRAWDPRSEIKPNFDNYVNYMKAQLAEIVKGYGPAILWFDGEWENTWTHERGIDLYNYVRSLKPDILVNNRVDKGRAGMAGMTVGDHLGDFGTPEQEIPANGFPGVDWESCMTFNDSWGFHQNDHNWKSAETIIRNLIDCASKGGNYLLNVGPTALGEIPGASIERLEAAGAWLKVNGEAIYGTKAGPFPKTPKWGRATWKPGKLYLHVFEPTPRLELPGLNAKVKKAYLLADKRPASVADTGQGIAVHLPPNAVGGAASVVVLEVTGTPSVESIPIRPNKNGTLTLGAEEAEVVGHTARYEAGMKQAIGFWSDAKDKVVWDVEFPRGGPFEVEVEIACEPGSEGSTFEVACNDAKVGAMVPATKGWADFVKLKVGEIGIRGPGKARIEVRAVKLAKSALMNLRAVRLRPL